MKLIVPCMGAIDAVDARLVRLAEFLAIQCETVDLSDAPSPLDRLSGFAPGPRNCLVINPRVMKQWVGPHGLSDDVSNSLLTHFSHVLVHAVRVDPFDDAIIGALSGRQLQSVRAIEGKGAVYQVAPDSKDFCSCFSGLSFGPANPTNDHVFSLGKSDSSLRPLISIDGSPFMAVLRKAATEVLFVASEDVVDLSMEVAEAECSTASDTIVVDYFSRLLPHCMMLRYAAGDQCWRPANAHASIIVDDPLLQSRYGFLNFDLLLRLTIQHNFHTVIAFIPHNFRRNSPRITEMFRLNPERLSICFHGNDHTGAEFASTDTTHLNTLLSVAEDRMVRHHEKTGLPCDRVMVFPQGNFSVEAMKVLKARNFSAAVNTETHPTKQPVRLTIGELVRPAVVRYGSFPLFIRKSIRQTRNYDIAFNLFFGRPVLIVEHHEIFQYPELLVDIAANINSVAPEVRWVNLAAAVAGSFITRSAPDGYHVRAFSSTIRISNESDSVRRYVLEWENGLDGAPIEQVLVDGVPCRDAAAGETGSRLSMALPPGSSRTFSLIHRNAYGSQTSLGFRWHTRAFVRRRLSEVRDNYLSKNQRLLNTAKAFRRRFQH